MYPCGKFLAGTTGQRKYYRCSWVITSANLDAYTDVKKSFGLYTVRCITTVGMGNALCVGDPPTAGNHVGTINLLCHLSMPLSESAFIEGVSIATEARTLAY